MLLILNINVMLSHELANNYMSSLLVEFSQN